MTTETARHHDARPRPAATATGGRADPPRQPSGARPPRPASPLPRRQLGDPSPHRAHFTPPTRPRPRPPTTAAGGHTTPGRQVHAHQRVDALLVVVPQPP